MQIQNVIFILDVFILFCFGIIIAFFINISNDITTFLDDFEVRNHMNNSIH